MIMQKCKFTKEQIENNRSYLKKCREQTLEELTRMLDNTKNETEIMSIEIAISEKSKETYTEKEVFDEINRQLNEKDYIRKNGISRFNEN